MKLFQTKAVKIILLIFSLSLIIYGILNYEYVLIRIESGTL